LTPSNTLIASTYNWPAALELLLLSVKEQSVLPNEVIIADDGSTNETKELIEQFKADFPIPLIHVWHEDKGHRKSMIMNKGIARSSYDYIIEVDGDIILHPDFIKDHLAMAEKNTFLYGSRVSIKKEVASQVLEKKQIRFNYFNPGLDKRNRTLRIPFLADLAKRSPEKSRKLRGCNVSFWREDFIAVNGYNEDFSGWGSEDSELIQRFLNNGVMGKRIKHRGIVFHIYHKEQDRSKSALHESIEHNTMVEKIIYTPNGVDKYLN
jgi:glycosyltransferase involved in cell wall biosynthesis